MLLAACHYGIKFAIRQNVCMRYIDFAAAFTHKRLSLSPLLFLLTHSFDKHRATAKNLESSYTNYNICKMEFFASNSSSQRTKNAQNRTPLHIIQTRFYATKIAIMGEFFSLQVLDILNQEFSFRAKTGNSWIQMFSKTQVMLATINLNLLISFKLLMFRHVFYQI